jgi:hypothetical protein
MLLFLLAGCTHIRPVYKVALIAPFEGLYRERGYEALTALRTALTTCVPAGVAILPVALDDSSQSEQAARAAQNLLADPSVTAIIGPLHLDQVDAVAKILAPSAVPWRTPFAIDPTGGSFGQPAAPEQWLAPLVAAVATAAQLEGATHLLVAGLPVTLPALHYPLPVSIVPDTSDITDRLDANSALLWLGRPEQGARLLIELRRTTPDLPVWLGPASYDLVFAGLAPLTGRLFWVVWQLSEYNKSAIGQSGSSPVGHLVFLATCDALTQVASWPEIGQSTWELWHYEVTPKGLNQLGPLPPQSQLQ